MPHARTPTPTPTPELRAQKTPARMMATPTGGGGRANYVFVTSQTTPGVLGGSAGGDAFCAGSAKGGLSQLEGLHWQAWLTTDTATAAARLASAFPGGKGLPAFALVDGTPVFAPNAQFDKSIQYPDGGTHPTWPLSPISRTEFGSTAALPNTVWTGTDATGGGLYGNCNNWSTAGATGATGNLTAADGRWSAYRAGGTDCSSRAHLYCFEVP